MVLRYAKYRIRLTEMFLAMVNNIRTTIPNIFLRIYIDYITKLTPALCNYQLTCSQYCIEVINQFGLLDGIILTTRRLKACSLDGQYLRQLNIKTKHFNKGSVIPKSYSPINYEEKIELLRYFSVILIIIGLAIGVIFYPNVKISIGFAMSYFILAMARLFQNRFYINMKLNWILMTIGLLPTIIISMPSMIFATMFNNIFEFSELESIVVGNDNNLNKKIGLIFTIIFSLISIAIHPVLACIMFLACFLIWKPLNVSKNDRVLDPKSLFISAFAAIAFYFDPIYAYPFITLWWYNKSVI